MIQGTGSNVGKSVLVAGLARALKLRGLRVLPFKPQNMSNNAAVTPGGEIGRAQALQARAAGVEARADMNPVLLKPESEIGAQVIVHGKRLTTARARDYAKLKPKLMAKVLESFERLSADADIVLVEGAGSPAEINLRKGDIANMGFAEAARVPVILAGDIDRGGVIAQVVGTQAVLPARDAALIKGFLINKFRGDLSLFDDGLAAIAERTGWRSIGVLPWFAETARLPAEDAADMRMSSGTGVKIAVLQFPRIANFDDFDPLRSEPHVELVMVAPGEPIPGDAALVILPGSKSTSADLAALRREGWDIDLAAHIRRGGRVLGICGGYQMLGREIADPEGIEGQMGAVEGLGLLDVATVMRPEKAVRPISGTALGEKIEGYEIHIGETSGPDCTRSWLEAADAGGSAASPDRRIRGIYLHGLFSQDAFRAAYLKEIGALPGSLNFEAGIDATLDALAAHMEHYLDIDGILEIAAEGLGG